MDSKERLRSVVNQINKANSYTNEDLSLALEYKARNYVSDIIGGTKSMSDLFLERLQKHFNVNPEYIKKGSEPIYFESNLSGNPGKKERRYPENNAVNILEEPLIEYLTKQLEKKDEKINELYKKIGELETKTKSENQVPPRLKRAR